MITRAAAVVVAALLCGCAAQPKAPDAASAAPPAPRALPAPQPPVDRERHWARIAWRYFENNTDFDTGLVNGTDRQPVFTMANLGDAIAATVAAHELEIIDHRDFDQRMSHLLGFLGSMELSATGLPNKAYHAVSGARVDFGGQPGDLGSSAIDIGRVLTWLRIAGQRYPALREYADRAVLRWRFCEVIDDCGALQGSTQDGGTMHRYPEGRLGYEQLAAAGFAAWGFDARRTLALPAMQVAHVSGVTVHYDARDPRTSGAPAPVLTMPWVLMAIEYGWHPPGSSEDYKRLGDEVQAAQAARFRTEGVLTARADYQTRVAPWVVLDSVYASGYPWNTLGGDGKEYERLALVAVKAAFGLWAVWPGDYGERVVQSVRYLYDPDRGWYEGRFESTGGIATSITASTNAAVLEALLYKRKGALYAREDKPGYFDARQADPYRRLDRCMPAERGACHAAR